MIDVHGISVGTIGTNCYIATKGNCNICAVIDPGDEAQRILTHITNKNFIVGAILITHGHFDHTMAADELSHATGAKIYVNEKDIASFDEHYSYHPLSPVTNYEEGDKVTVGDMEFEVMETPGHSPGSVTLLCENALFTGDVLFKDSCGRTDLPGGNMDILLKSLLRLYNLNGDYDVYPGHMESSTLERERKYNYYMKYAAENN